ncbi:hypothetical protein K6I33_001526, partial [Streptomyces sp. UNOB3_S3]|nr:hypothetical protein [Streptomyces sp. UNOB3_S3]
MSASLPLIIRQEAVHPHMGRGKPERPGVAFLYATPKGDIVRVSKQLSWRQRSKYVRRYEVDMGDHHRTAKLHSTPLPSADQAHCFEATIDMSFRVTEPEEIVRRNIQDGLPLVYRHLAALFRPVARRFAIEDAAGLETHLNQQCRSAMKLDEGVTIFRCVVSIAPDAAASAHIRERTKLQRELELGQQRFDMEQAAQQHRLRLDAEGQRARLAREATEQSALAGTPMDIQGLLTRHLQTHPGDTAYVMDMLLKVKEAEGRQRQLDDERSVDLFRFMTDRGIIQPADVEMLRGQALGRIGLTGPTAQQSPALPP